MKSKIKWIPLAIVMVSLNSCGLPNISFTTWEETLKHCRWGGFDITFMTKELSIPDCINLMWSSGNIFYTFGEIYSCAYYEPDGYGEFIWTSTGEECDDETRIRTTIFNTNEHATYLQTAIDAWIDIDSALVLDGISPSTVIGTACVKLENVIDRETGDRLSLVWESPEYNGSSFTLLEFKEEANCVRNPEFRRVYVHNDYQ